MPHAEAAQAGLYTDNLSRGLVKSASAQGQIGPQAAGKCVCARGSGYQQALGQQALHDVGLPELAPPFGLGAM